MATKRIKIRDHSLWFDGGLRFIMQQRSRGRRDYLCRRDIEYVLRFLGEFLGYDIIKIRKIRTVNYPVPLGIRRYLDIKVFDSEAGNDFWTIYTTENQSVFHIGCYKWAKCCPDDTAELTRLFHFLCDNLDWEYTE